MKTPRIDRLAGRGYIGVYAKRVFEIPIPVQVFLGECMDFQVRVGETLLLARAHPSLRTPVGGTVHITMNPEKCVAIRNTASK